MPSRPDISMAYTSSTKSSQLLKTRKRCQPLKSHSVREQSDSLHLVVSAIFHRLLNHRIWVERLLGCCATVGCCRSGSRRGEGGRLLSLGHLARPRVGRGFRDCLGGGSFLLWRLRRARGCCRGQIGGGKSGRSSPLRVSRFLARRRGLPAERFGDGGGLSLRH